MEAFAQSREDIDLMADDFEPASSPIVEEITTDPKLNGIQDSHVLCLDDQIKKQFLPGQRQDEACRDRRRRGRGRPNTREHNSGPTATNMAASKKIDQSSASQSAVTMASESTLQKNSDANPFLTDTVTSSVRMPAVRGDRSLTGGLSVVKLTEAELTAKFEMMRIINASRTEKHRLQQADQAAFQCRVSEIVKENLEKEIKERAQQVEMERERSMNREHKIKGIGRREWDAGKKERDLIDNRKARTSEYVKYGHGFVKNDGLKNIQLKGGKFRNDDRTSAASNKGRGGYKNHNKVPLFTSTKEFPSISSINEQKFASPKAPIKNSFPRAINSMSSNQFDIEDTILAPTVKLPPQYTSNSHALRSAETAENPEKHGKLSESKKTKENRDWAEEMSVLYEQNKAGLSAA